MNFRIAVFDIGKTNKKLLVYDRDLRVADRAFASFPEVPSPRDPSILLEDTEAIERWLIAGLQAAAEKHRLKAIGISCHGATFACVDAEGRLTVPVVSYATEPGEKFHEEFFALAGSADLLQRTTATAAMGGLLNVAQGVHFAKKTFPEDFARTRMILSYPQYYGCFLTGRTGAEPTYSGCHTYLRDFATGRWSEVADRLGVAGLLPAEMKRPWDVLGTLKPEIAAATGLSEDTLVPLGVHDSNSALLPYLLKHGEDFVLNSTGTWCVAMHPADRVSFEDDEIGKMVFFNADVFGRPVKTSIFMAGLEFETYSALIRKTAGTSEVPPFDPENYKKIVRERALFILPSVVRGTGQFPASQPRIVEKGRTTRLEDLRSGKEVPSFFRDAKTAYAVLNLSLAVQTKVALARAGAKDGVTIFTEGGFRKNEDYNRLVTALFPASPVSLTGMDEASAFGAALLAKAAVEGKDPRELAGCFDLEYRPVARFELPGLASYAEAFLERL